MPVNRKLIITCRNDAPIMCWASGGIGAVMDDGAFLPVVSASGQWLGVPALTRQMREALIPDELNRRVCELAGS